MNSTTQTPTTPQTLRQLAAGAYAEKIKRETAERENARREFHRRQVEDFAKIVASRLTKGTGGGNLTMEWNETDEAPYTIIDGMTFVPTNGDGDPHHIDGIAYQAPDGRRHRIESLADLGALLAQAEDAPDPEDKWEKRARIFSEVSRMTTDEIAAELQEFAPESLPLAPPMSKTYAEGEILRRAENDW